MNNVYILDEAQSSQNNGIGTYVRSLCSCLSSTPYKTTVVGFNAGVDEFELALDGQTMRLPQFEAGNFTDNAPAVAALLEMHVPDHQSNVFILNHSPCIDLLYRLKEVFPLSKFIYVIHDMCWTALLLGRRKLLNPTIQGVEQERQQIEMADRVVCLNQDTYSVLIEEYGIKSADKLVVVGNGLVDNNQQYDQRSLRRALHLDETEPIALYVGRLTHAKGLNVLLDAFEQALQEVPNMHLAVVGAQDPQASPVDVPHRLASRIVFTGQLSQQELAEWYAVSDVGVLPSYSEQCSFVGIEMMMRGMAVVAADSFGLRCMFRDRHDALVASRQGDFTHNFASCMVGLARNASLRQQLGRNARQTYIERYSLRAMRCDYLRLLDNMCYE